MPLSQSLAFTLGIFAVLVSPELPDAIWLVGLAIPVFLPWRWRSIYACAALGALITTLRSQAVLDQRWPESRYGEEVWVQGHIASLPDVSRTPLRASGLATDATHGRTWRFLFETNAGDAPPSIRAAWYRNEQILKGGECWRMLMRLRPPHGSMNPGGFDYEGWLFAQGVGATATVKAAEPCGEQSGYALLKMRQSLIDDFRQWLPESAARGLFIALTLGDTSELSSEDWHLFRVTGTTHLVAISGFNIAVVSGIAFFIMRWLWCLWPPLLLKLPAQKAAMMGATLLALIYALLAGWEPPVQRAFLMLAFISFAAWTGRLSQPSKVLALAWFVVLLLDPLAVLAPGLWLSFGAVAAIFYVMMNRLHPLRLLPSLIMLQLMLSLVLAPLTVWYFHGLSWFAPLLNLFAVPLFSVITPVLLLAILLALVLPAWGVPMMQWCTQLLAFLHEGLGWFEANVPQPWISASATPAALVLALIAVLLMFAPRGLPLRLLGLLCLMPLLFPINQAPERGFDLTALDVGQGLSVVVRTANHSMVYDVGPAFDDGFDAGSAIVAPFLLDQGIRRLDLLVISHADNDHSGGADALRKLIPIDREMGALTATPCRDGQRWEWDGVTFEMLHPDASAWSSNNGGCVLRIESGAYATLLPADIEKKAEARLLNERLPSLQADVLLAPHHGSRTSSTEDFVEAVQAQWVIHSAAWRSHFRHPTPIVVARYARAGVQQVVTGLRGAVSLHIDESGITPPTFARDRQHHFWNTPSQVLEIDLNAGDGPKLRKPAESR